MNHEEIGQEIGQLVDKKNKAYGDSFAKCSDFLEILYPDGVEPEDYRDILTLVRMFDKMMRIANQKDAFDESPYQDIAGYALLATKEERNDRD